MLITAFPLPLKGLGVMSGINATAGERYTFIATIISNNNIAIVKRLPFSNKGMAANASSATGNPTIINGTRLPITVCVLSDNFEINGIMKRAKKLSRPITDPIIKVVKSECPSICSKTL